jgi:radical SAM protein with 4Fe4S-binding SPASM domain
MRISVFNKQFQIAEILRVKRIIFEAAMHPKKIWNFLKVRNSLKKRNVKVDGLPIVINIEPTVRCNMNCTFCPPVLNKLKHSKGDMDIVLFKKIIDELGDTLLFLNLYNYGEPLLHKNITDMVGYAKAKNILVCINTNALALNQDVANGLINARLDYMIVSLNGATPEVYSKYQGSMKDFEKVICNLKMLVDLRGNRKFPFIDIQFVVMRENEHQIMDMKKLVKEIGADKLSLKKFIYKPTDENSETIKNIMPKNKDYAHFADENSPCYRVFNSAIIEWDGTVRPCCADIEHYYDMGNVNEQNFQSLWNNTKYNQLRSQVLKDITKISICKTCTTRGFSNEIYI